MNKYIWINPSVLLKQAKKAKYVNLLNPYMAWNRHQSNGMKSLIPAWLKMVLKQMSVISAYMSWNNWHVIICLFVDDLLIFGSNMNVIDEAKNVLRSHFDMKDLGEVNFILWIKITRTSERIFLDQSHYVEFFLKKYKFHDCKHVSTPFD